MKPLTIYLLTVEQGDYYTQPVTIRAYSSNGPTSKLDKLLRRLDRYYKLKPNMSEVENPEWYEQLVEWQKKHPISPDYAYLDRDDFKVQPIQLR